jgi:hypothetical protein
MPCMHDYVVAGGGGIVKTSVGKVLGEGSEGMGLRLLVDGLYELGRRDYSDTHRHVVLIR